MLQNHWCRAHLWSHQLTAKAFFWVPGGKILLEASPPGRKRFMHFMLPHRNTSPVSVWKYFYISETMLFYIIVWWCCVISVFEYISLSFLAQPSPHPSLWTVSKHFKWQTFQSPVGFFFKANGVRVYHENMQVYKGVYTNCKHVFTVIVIIILTSLFNIFLLISLIINLKHKIIRWRMNFNPNLPNKVKNNKKINKGNQGCWRSLISKRSWIVEEFK